jgi:hypothetical protein
MNSRQITARASILLLPLLLTACSPSAEKRLIGTWQADTAQIAEQLKADGNPLAGAFERVAENSSLTVELKQDGEMSYQLQLPVVTKDGSGTWRVLEENDDTATIEWRYQQPNTGEEVIDHTAVTVESNDRIRMKPPLAWAQLMYFDRLPED